MTKKRGSRGTNGRQRTCAGMTPQSAASLDLLRRFAPGTPLRDAAELVMAQGTGALVLIGTGPRVDAVTAGGFVLEDAQFTAQRLAELVDRVGARPAQPAHHFAPAVDVLEERIRVRREDGAQRRAAAARDERPDRRAVRVVRHRRRFFSFFG